MIKIKYNNGVEQGIKNTGWHEGKMFTFAKGMPTSWAAKYPMFKLTGNILASGSYNKYELVANTEWTDGVILPEGKKGAKRQKKDGAPKPEPKKTEPKEQPVPTPAPEPKPEPKPKQEQPKREASGDNVDATAKAIADALKGLKVQGDGKASVDEEQVRTIVLDTIADLAKKSDTAKIVEVAKTKTKGKHPMLDTLVQMVANDRAIGRFPWLYGPAGTGKSTLAKQVAEELGLPFYSVSSLQQKYELEGYTDATGELVETSFFKAWTNGGVFLFDEASTTSAEVQVAFNTAIAQLVYNFPKVGMLEAHKDFHIIAADNTVGRGGDKSYNARFELDSSTLDRYTFIEIDYNRDVEIELAQNDAELVDFMRKMREQLKAADLTYTATPRALRAIATFVKMGMPAQQALSLGLCSGWDKQDVRTLQARMTGTGKWYTAFSKC